MILKGILALVVCLAVAGVAVADEGMGYDKPKSVAATCSSSSAQVSWAAVVNSNLSGYNVYYKTASESTYMKANAGLVTTTEFVVMGLSSGITYDFGVTAVYLDGNPSSMSGPAMCTAG